MGDLNGDGVADALFLIMIEDIGSKGNWRSYYAVFQNENNNWKYQCHLYSGSKRTDLVLEILQIKNEKIIGNWLREEDKENIPVTYIFKNGRLINNYMALHIDQNKGILNY